MFDGIAYPLDGSGPRDTCLMEAGSGEDIYIADVDMSAVRQYRSQEVHGNAFRRPWKYHILTDETVTAPFVRDKNRKIR